VIFGSKVIVKVNGNTLGMADHYRARWLYPIGKRPVFGSQMKARLTQSFDGELQVEGLWTTDNTLHTLATPVSGVLPTVTVVIEETDIQATPVLKTWTFTGQMSPYEKEGQADQFVIVRFTVDLSAEPTCT